MDNFVCHKCVNDCVLSEVVLAQATSLTCSYCRRKGRGSPIAAAFDDLVCYIREVIHRDFTDDLDSEIAWDPEEESYVEGVLEIWDVLQHLDFKPLSDDLYNDVCQAMADTSYAKIGYYPGTVSERTAISWDYFCRTVRHSRRFTFWDDKPDSWEYDYSPAEMLEKITETARESGLIRPLPLGTRFWRVRNHDARANPLNSDEEFTSVPVQWATDSNRMSPAGIPMFYGANDFMTACKEVIGRHHSDRKKLRVTGVQFETVGSMNVLDLTSVAPPRSAFEKGDHLEWQEKRFFRHFVRDVSRPINKGGGGNRQHVDYVPTQVFTEVVRYRLKHNDQPISGILYPSCYDRHPCAVIFATQEECLPTSGVRQLLQAVPGTRKYIAVSAVKRALRK